MPRVIRTLPTMGFSYPIGGDFKLVKGKHTIVDGGFRLTRTDPSQPLPFGILGEAAIIN
eukprot:c28267_g2_i1 orf=244-420(-)